MLYEWIRNYVKKYTFIDDVAFKGGVFYMYYTDSEGRRKSSKLPYRATKEQLERRISLIKKETDFKTVKAERDQKVRESIKYVEPVLKIY